MISLLKDVFTFLGLKTVIYVPKTDLRQALRVIRMRVHLRGKEMGNEKVDFHETIKKDSMPLVEKTLELILNVCFGKKKV